MVKILSIGIPLKFFVVTCLKSELKRKVNSYGPYDHHPSLVTFLIYHPVACPSGAGGINASVTEGPLSKSGHLLSGVF